MGHDPAQGERGARWHDPRGTWPAPREGSLGGGGDCRTDRNRGVGSGCRSGTRWPGCPVGACQPVASAGM